MSLAYVNLVYPGWGTHYAANPSYPDPQRNWSGRAPMGFSKQSPWAAGRISGLGATSGITPTVAKQMAGILSELQGRLAQLDPRTRILGVTHSGAISFSGGDNLTASLDADSTARYRAAWANVVQYLNDHPLQDGSKPDPSFPPDKANAGDAATWLSHIVAIVASTASADAAGKPTPATTADAIAQGSGLPGWVKTVGLVVGVVVLKKLLF